ncbi:MAG: MFS transporter [Novosphingobium sp.]|nr:MFS transporter [Novosphingobium sp.]
MNEAAPSAAAEWRRHWPLVAAATAGMSLAAVSTSAFGVMVMPIEQDVGWSRTEISGGPLLISVTVICVGWFYGLLIDKIGPRSIALFSVASLSACTALLSQIGSEVWQWWALWALIGLTSAAAPAVWVTAVTRCFSAGRGMAMAVVLSGSGLSSFIVPNLASYFVEIYGWRTAYLYIGGIWFAVVFTLVLLFLRLPRSEPATTEAGEQAPPAEALPGLTARQGLSSMVYYKLLLATVIANFAGISLLMNLVPIMQSTGLSAASAAFAFSFVGIATITGRIISGGLLDRFNARMIAAGAGVLMAILPLLLLAFHGNFVAAIIGVSIYGMMGGAMMPCIAYLASRHLGQRAFGTLYAIIMGIMSIGIGLGPMTANFIYDRMQSYEPVLWGTLPLFAIGALLFLSLGAYPDFTKEEKPA